MGLEAAHFLWEGPVSIVPPTAVEKNWLILWVTVRQGPDNPFCEPLYTKSALQLC